MSRNTFNNKNRSMLKRKYCSISGNESGEDKLKEMITENLIDTMMGSNKKGRHHNEEVYRENNHIYFRTDVNVENCDVLLRLVREFEEEMKAYKSDPYMDDDHFIKPNLYIHLTTYGGDLYAGFLVYDTLKLSKSRIVTIAEGYVASAGTVMSLGGAHRQVQKSAVMMIHQLRTVIGGKFDEIEEDFKNTQMDMKRLIDLYHRELGGKMKKKEINDVLTRDTWWDATTCVAKGLCNEVI